MSQSISQDLDDALRRVGRRLPDLAARSVDMYVSASPHYQGLSTEHIYRHMAHSSRECGRLLLRGIRQQRAPRPTELRGFVERARERADEGLPVADLLDAYHQIFALLWDALAEEVSKDAGAELGSIASECLRTFRRLLYAVTEAHQQEFVAMSSEVREAARDVAQSLIAGRPAAELADRLGIRIADSYTVLALHLGESPVEVATDEVGRRVSGRRRMRRVQAEIERALGRDLLLSLEPTGGTVLLPGNQAESPHHQANLRKLMSAMEVASGAPVTGGLAYARTVAAVPQAAVLAKDLLDLSRAHGGHESVGMLDNLLVEYHLSRPSAARTGLRNVSEQLNQAPELTDTLDTYFAHDFNRRRTARVLKVHPNTIDNRLARIADITGVDPRTSRGLMLLGSALTLDRFSPTDC